MARHDQRRPADPIRVAGGEEPPDRVRIGLRGAPARVVLVAVVIAVLGALVFLRFDGPEQPAAATSTTSTTSPGLAAPAEPPWWETSFHEGQQVTLPGWERLDPGPIDGLAPGAVAWTGREIFVWGGGPGFDNPGVDLFGTVPGTTLDAHLYDPAARSWRSAAPVPDSMCRPWGGFDAVPAGDVIVVRYYGDLRDGCTTVAAYHPADDAWQPLRDPFFLRATPGKPLVWTGDLLVSPSDGLAHHWSTGVTIDLPAVPGTRVPAAEAGAFWTGSAVLVAGSGGILSWTPGAESWDVIDDEPVHSSFFSSGPGALTESGLLVVDLIDGARFHDGTEWRSAELGGGHGCVGGVVQATVPVVNTCGGYVIWDDLGALWTPVPTAVLGAAGLLVEADGALYSVGAGLHRMEPPKAGSVVGPSTVPVGGPYLDVPDGMVVVSALHEVESPEPNGLPVDPNHPPYYPVAETTGAVIEDRESGARCRVATVVDFDGAGAAIEGEHAGEIVVERLWLPDLSFALLLDEGAATLVAIDGRTSAFVGVQVSCVGDGAESSALRLAAGLWASWEGDFWYGYRGDWDTGDTPPDPIGPIPFYGTPDRARSAGAQAIFLACVESSMPGPRFALGWLRMFVDADDVLLHLNYWGVRHEVSPPVAPVPDDIRDLCLERAQVAEPFFRNREDTP